MRPPLLVRRPRLVPWVNAADWFFRAWFAYGLLTWGQRTGHEQAAIVVYVVLQAICLVVWLRTRYWRRQLRLAEQDLAATKRRTAEQEGEIAVLRAERIVLDELGRIVKGTKRMDEP